MIRECLQSWVGLLNDRSKCMTRNHFFPIRWTVWKYTIRVRGTYTYKIHLGYCIRATKRFCILYSIGHYNRRNLHCFLLLRPGVAVISDCPFHPCPLYPRVTVKYQYDMDTLLVCTCWHWTRKSLVQTGSPNLMSKSIAVTISPLEKLSDCGTTPHPVSPVFPHSR